MTYRMRSACVVVVVATVCAAWAACSGEVSESAARAVAAWSRAVAAGAQRYSVESTVLLNAAERRDRELGYRIVADLTLHPFTEDGDLLLRFQLEEPRVMLRGAHRSAEWERRGSEWESHGHRAWVARLRHGTVRHVLLPPDDPPDVQDYKVALVSLFQIVAGGAGGNETDISGECEISYEALSDTSFRKIKRVCGSDESAGVSARRVARYELGGGGAPARVYAEELVTLQAALKARSWHALSRHEAPPPPPPPPPGAPPSARELAALSAVPLAPRRALPDDEDALLEVGEAINKYIVALEGEEPGAGGSVEQARAVLRLLPAVRAATTSELLHVLRDAAHRDLLPGLCRALGLAGSAAAVRAARDFLHLAARDPLEPLAHAFLAGFALAPSAQEEAVLDVLKLGEEARRAGIGESALLAAAGAARGDEARAAVRDALLRALPKCGDEACLAVRLAALGNVRADAAEALVGHAERSPPRAAAAAVRALRSGPALSARHMERVGLVATNSSAPLEVRAAALELVVQRRADAASPAAPLQLLEIARALHAERSRAAHELRRVLWQRVEALRDAPPLRALLPLLPPELRTWDARAHGGTSSVLRRDTGWGAGAGGWRAWLDSAQVAAGGLLRRGTVALLLQAPDNSTAPELEVEVWTRGLEAVAGSAGGEGAEGEEGAAGGLTISVGGIRMKDVMLFDGQAELLGHVWAGTGSAPTAVARALHALVAQRGVVPLLGGGALAVRTGAAAALALDAHAAVSLWQRTARGALQLRAALHADVSAELRTAWAHVRAARSLGAAPRLRIAFDLDFYDGVALCVRAATPHHTLQRSLELESAQGARRWRVARGASSRLEAAGRTLALGRTNDAACRALRPSNADDEHSPGD